MTMFMRWRPGEERRTRRDRYGPLPTGHPLVGYPCFVCDTPLAVGDVPTLWAVGPLGKEAEAKHEAASWYSALAVAGHQHCIWKED